MGRAPSIPYTPGLSVGTDHGGVLHHAEHRPVAPVFFGKIGRVSRIVMTRRPDCLPKFSRLPSRRGTHAESPWVGRAAFPAWWWTAVIGAWVAWPVAIVAAPPASVYGRAAGVSDAAGDGDAAAQAERIVASCLDTLARADTVSLRLRQKVRIGDLSLVGAGRYLQAGHGEEQRFRFESTLTCKTESFEITEVSDGLFFWSHRRISDAAPELHRVDIQRVRSRLEEMKVPEPQETAPYLGGLQRFLWWTRQWFWFKEAVPGELGGVPVWFVTGRTPPEGLALVMPELAEAAKQPDGIRPENLPDGWPFEVRLAVGRSDLLPRQVEYLGIPGKRPVAAGEVEPVAVIEFVEIEINGPVDHTAFFYQPAAEGLIDLTTHHINMMGRLRP